MTDALRLRRANGGTSVLVSAVALTGLGMVLLVVFFPLAVIPSVFGGALALWARRQFASRRRFFSLLAVVCMAVAATSVTLDLTLLASSTGASPTQVVPV